MTFLYIVTKYLTFPGVYVRCMWEQIVCRITKTPVEDTRYIRDDEMSSHIDHELIESPSGSLAIALVPFIFNCIAAFFLGLFPFFFRPTGAIASVSTSLSMWFCFSLCCNLFPQVEDALNMVDKIYKKGNILQKILFAPFVAVFFIGAYLERYCITFIIAVAILVTEFIM
mgnify:CR=1 FL=1